MFYAKSKIGEDTEIKINLTYDNIYTVCPMCGAEHSINLQEVIQNGDDLVGTTVYCSECSTKYGNE